MIDERPGVCLRCVCIAIAAVNATAAGGGFPLGREYISLTDRQQCGLKGGRQLGACYAELSYFVPAHHARVTPTRGRLQRR